MRAQLKSHWGPAFSPLFLFFFSAYFEWGLSTKLINIIVQSHLYSLAELPAEIQTGQKETDGLLRIPRVCLPDRTAGLCRAGALPYEGHSLRHH